MFQSKAGTSQNGGVNRQLVCDKNFLLIETLNDVSLAFSGTGTGRRSITLHSISLTHMYKYMSPVCS